MRPTYSHFVARAWQIIAAVCISISLSAEDFSADSVLLDAYQREDMSVWERYVDTATVNPHNLIYEYGLCGYKVDRDKPHALPYVLRFQEHLEALKAQLPAGHYEMYLSSVYVYKLRLHETFRPVKAMSLAKEATKLAPNDPLVLCYYGTSLFFAPKPFGSKAEALSWFEKAEKHFRKAEWKYCWVKVFNDMYIGQCHEKLNR